MINFALWFRRHMVVAALSCLSCIPTQAAETRNDVVYLSRGQADLRLDLSIPDGEGPFPTTLLIHGGGWSGGDRKSDVARLGPVLSLAGFVSCSIDYRLAPAHPWPACIEDAQAAVKWVRDHAAEFKGDPKRIALLGYSAGGHLACYAAVLADDHSSVQAVAALAAPTDHVADSERRGGLSQSMQNLLGHPPELDADSRAMLREISPINYVKPGLPPFLLFHGTADTSVPYSQGTNFQSRLNRANVESDLITLTNAPHRISEWSKSDPNWQKKLVDWLQSHLIP